MKTQRASSSREYCSKSPSATLDAGHCCPPQATESVSDASRARTQQWRRISFQIWSGQPNKFTHPYKVFDDVYFFFFGADFIFRGKVKKLLCPATVYYTYSYRLIDTLMYVTIKKNLVNKLSSYQLNSVHYILIIILQNPHFLIFGFNTYKTTKCPPPPKCGLLRL